MNAYAAYHVMRQGVDPWGLSDDSGGPERWLPIPDIGEGLPHNQSRYAYDIYRFDKNWKFERLGLGGTFLDDADTIGQTSPEQVKNLWEMVLAIQDSSCYELVIRRSVTSDIVNSALENDACDFVIYIGHGGNPMNGNEGLDVWGSAWSPNKVSFPFSASRANRLGHPLPTCLFLSCYNDLISQNAANAGFPVIQGPSVDADHQIYGTAHVKQLIDVLANFSSETCLPGACKKKICVLAASLSASRIPNEPDYQPYPAKD